MCVSGRWACAPGGESDRSSIAAHVETLRFLRFLGRESRRLKIKRKANPLWLSSSPFLVRSTIFDGRHDFTDSIILRALKTVNRNFTQGSYVLHESFIIARSHPVRSLGLKQAGRCRLNCVRSHDRKTWVRRSTWAARPYWWTPAANKRTTRKPCDRGNGPRKSPGLAVEAASETAAASRKAACHTVSTDA